MDRQKYYSNMKVMTIGRSSENDVVINDIKVSRHHLQIIQNDYGNFRLSDFGSANGTFINGRKISGEIILLNNDIVRIGNTTLTWKDYFSDQSVVIANPVPIIHNSNSDNCKPSTYNIYNESSHKEIKIDYNEGNFGRKFGQGAGKAAGNVVGCFVGIIIVLILIVLLAQTCH